VSGEYVLVWDSGHNPPKPVYFEDVPGFSVACTYDREKAKRFISAQAARQQWLKMHSSPEDYERYLHDGSVRAELFAAPDLLAGNGGGI
jgi:hypothetical protein